MGEEISALQARIRQLEEENAFLRHASAPPPEGAMVIVPEGIRPLFDQAQQAVSEYFRHLKMDPTKGTIGINEERYVLVRASALSKDFLDTIGHLYEDRGRSEALSIGKNFLFDIAHVIGMNDARAFHQKMNLTDPLAKLSAGPVHFAYSGWSFVEILPESHPTPDDDCYLIYHHPYSFEADSWLRSGTKADTSVCIMNAGYSSGWSEESFGLPLTSVEVSCRAKGDSHCTFIMSPPHRIQEHLDKYRQAQSADYESRRQYEIPTFFERKRVEEELQRATQLAEESVRTKSDFVANISHELRTPLGAILGFTDLLRKTELAPEQQDYLQAIQTSGSNLLAIINDILDLSKIDAGKVLIEQIPFSIREVVDSVELMFSARAAFKSLQFSCTTDPAISGYVLGDPTRLTQILTNLVSNAIKFTNEGSVELDCRLEGEAEDKTDLSFTVRDTGIGIPREKAAHIFERFTQADSDITRKYGGTGLGLAITKQLVELQGGTITMESSAGMGATFRVLLSYPRSEAPPAPDDAGLLQPQQDTGQKILLAEDNYMVQKLAGIVLKQAGYSIGVAENGQAAIDLLLGESFDLILMDIQMPVMDGYRAAKVIRGELRRDIPIIAMTAHALRDEKEQCRSAGMNDYIQKPFKEAELLGKIAYWLGKAPKRSAPLPDRIVDLSYLRQQSRDNKAFISDMISYFKAHNPEDIAQLEAALLASDYEGIYRITHRLRNTILFFGLQAYIGRDLEEMEHMAASGNGIDRIAALFGQVKPVFARAVGELSDPEPNDPQTG